MRIRHSRLTRDFLQVPNATVRDDRLSHMARGILVELLSRPDGWEATADGMWQASVAKHGKASPGRRVFRAAFAELKEHGYLTAGREPLPGGRHATILMLADVPQAGTSVRPAETSNTPAQTDVPQGGTSVMLADVPVGGTSEPPAETSIRAGRTDVPLSDVPPCGTSKEENGETNTGENTLSSPRDSPGAAVAAEERDYHWPRFGEFWVCYPRRRQIEKAKQAWCDALDRGADPDLIIKAAKAFAGERKGEDPRYTPYPATWLNAGSYEDQPDEAGGPYRNPEDASGYHEDWN